MVEYNSACPGSWAALFVLCDHEIGRCECVRCVLVRDELVGLVLEDSLQLRSVKRSDTRQRIPGCSFVAY